MASNWNLLGHEWAVDMLKQHVANHTARHAYLFTGSAGLGKRTLAIRFAQALNCETPISAGEPCSGCLNCRKFESMQHPDLNVVQVEPDKRDVSVEQIRNTTRSLVLKPYQSMYKIALFLNFQDASVGASNALLKTLEEAPAHAVLLLTVENPEQLLPTILSRCEILRMRPLPLAMVEADLIGRGIEADRAKLLAHISGGRPGFARRLVDDEGLLEKREERLDDLQTLMPAQRVEKFSYAEKLAKDKDGMRQAILFWLSYWRDVMLCAAEARTPLINVDRNIEIQSVAGRLDLSAARRTVHQLEDALEKIDRNVNPRLLAEVLLLDLPSLK